MHYKIIPFLVVGTVAANADPLSSTQRFLDDDDNFAEYSEDGGKIDGFEVDEVPYSPADSDLGVQEVLVERNDVAPVIFRFNTEVFRTDNAATSNALRGQPSWVSSTNASVSWRPHLLAGWFGDVGANVGFLRFEDRGAIDYETYSGRVGIYKNFPDLDDMVFFTRYEYQRLTTGSLQQSDYDAERIRAGVQKTLYAAPRHRITAGLSGALEWSTSPDILQRNEIELNLSHRYAITDNVYTLARLGVSRFKYEDFGREDWNYGMGLELVWEMSRNLQLSASVFYDKNDSNTASGVNDYQSWTGGLGVGLQWAF